MPAGPMGTLPNHYASDHYLRGSLSTRAGPIGTLPEYLLPVITVFGGFSNTCAGPTGTFSSEFTYVGFLDAHRPREAIASACVCLGLHEAHTPPLLYCLFVAQCT